MLRGIRKASANWLGRIVMGVVMTVLAGSFAVWGINDIFRGYGATTVAKIGGTEIGVEQFRQTYNDRLQQLGQQLGRPVTREQASAFGLDRQVLSEMVAQAGLDERARQMRLGLSNAEIARRITNDPHFQTPGGLFDRARFQDALRNAGFNEQRYVTEQRNTTVRRQIIDTVSGNIQVPKTWLDAINQFQNEERSIAYVALGAAQAGDIPKPTDDQLSKYFDERRIMFRAPEYRKIVTVAATPAELAKTVEVSDDDVKKVFDQNHSRYITPERRHVEQMVFPTMAEAEAASERIKGGMTFAALATKRGLKAQDLDLGTVTKSTIIDPAVADAAFALKDGEVSAPVQGRFGAVIVAVSQIVPEDDKTFADVAPQIRNEIALARTKKIMQEVHDKIEDDRAGGSTLEEAARKLKLPVVTYDAVDRSGHDPDGKSAANIPDAAQVISAAFATDIGVDNDPIEAEGGYIWYDMTGITPAHERPLDEVKSQVEEHWRDDEIATRLKTKTADILDKLKSGSTLETLAAADGLKVQAAAGIKRGQSLPVISSRAISDIFKTAKDGFGSAEGDKPTDWIVFRVTDIKTPAFDANAADAKRIEQTVQQQVSDDVFGQYMAWLEKQLGTSINQTALAQAVGNGAPAETN
jgi:peptidyl-prolyl cis-trans isomerase D